MTKSTRAAWATALGLAGLAAAVAPTLAQQTPDPKVQKAASGSQAAAPAAKALGPSTIGTVDMEAVFRGYHKAKVLSEEYSAAFIERKNQLMQIMQEGRQYGEQIQKLAPNGPDFKKLEQKMMEMKAKAEAMKEQSEAEFSRRQAESMATLYKEAIDVVARVAQYRKMTYILRVNSAPIAGSDPESLSMAMSRSVLYADPTNDITGMVSSELNRLYLANGGVAPKAAPATVTAPPATPGASR